MTSTKPIYLSSTIIQSSKETVRLYSCFENIADPSKVKNDENLAEIIVLTHQKSYRAKLQRKNVNKQLAWNADLINRLQTILAGKDNLIIHLEQGLYGKKKLIIVTELQFRSIKIVLFEVDLIDLYSHPFNVMRNLMENLHVQKSQCIQEMKRRERQQRENLNRIDQVSNQIKQSSKDQLNLMKQMFIPVVNEAKKKLRKCFNITPQLMQDFQTQGKNHQVSSDICSRNITKIKNVQNIPNKMIGEKKSGDQQLFDLLN